MICENCKQRPATVTVTMTKNNQRIERHYCEVCSSKQDFAQANSKALSIEDIFSSWFGIPAWSADAPHAKDEKEAPIQCEKCHTTYERFLHEGKFNCPDCYESFHEVLPAVFKRLHNGATEHTGKIPNGLNTSYKIKKQIESLREQMKDAVQLEEFERAASLRDEVKELEATLNEGGVEKNGD